MEIQYYTKNQIIIAHYAVMQRYDDLDQAGVKFQDRFEAMLERPKTVLFNKEKYPRVFDKACCYYHSIATQHIFHNGNKRTAATMFVTFLRMHGLNIRWSNEDLEEYTVRLVVEEKYKDNDWLDYMKLELEPLLTF